MAIDIIVGIHSIAEAIKERKSSIKEIVATEDGIDELIKRGGISKKVIETFQITLVSSHKLQELGGEYYKKIDMNFQRIPSQIFAVVKPIQVEDITWLYEKLERNEGLKVLCLDQITDVHNAAAIMRTAAFYGVDCIVNASKGNFGMGPSFARIASGALEHVTIVQCASLPKALKKLKERGLTIIGFSEHADSEAMESVSVERVCLVVGAEDVGISNAVSRVVDIKVAIKSLGKIQSLNVSVAAAIAMERYFK